MTFHRIQQYNSVLYDVLKMMITKLFYFDLSRKSFCQNILRLKSFKPNLRYQVMEASALRAEAEAI